MDQNDVRKLVYRVYREDPERKHMSFDEYLKLLNKKARQILDEAQS